MAALGAKAAKRPVKIAMQRPLMFNNSTHRPATIQRVRLGAGPDGRITAIDLNTGDHIWMRANGDASARVKNHPGSGRRRDRPVG